MMVVTHGLKIPEKLSPLSPEKIQIYDSCPSVSPLFASGMCPVWAQMFKQLGLASFESTGREKDAGRGLKQGAGPQSCGEVKTLL